MENNTQETVKEALVRAPADIQSAIFSDSLSEECKKLATTHSLSDEHAKMLKEEIIFVLLGLTEEVELPQNIQVRLSVPPLRAHEIVSDIRKDIFAPIQKSLDVISGKIGNEDVTVPPLDSKFENRNSNFPSKEPELSFEGTVRLKSVSDVAPKPQQTTSPAAQPTTNTSSLPDDVQKTMSSPEVAKKIQAIGQKHQLHVDTVGTLLDETQLVMKGETHPKEYIKNLTKRLSVSDTKAKEVAVDINEQIFRPIRESLKKVHRIGEDSPGSENKNYDLQEKKNNGQPMPEPLKSRSYNLKPAERQKTFTQEEAIKELEYPPKVGTSENSAPISWAEEKHKPNELLEKKMGGVFALPQKEAIPQNSANDRRGEIKKRDSYELDPYREPAE